MTFKIVKIRRKDNAEIFNLMSELPEWFNAGCPEELHLRKDISGRKTAA